MGSTRVLLVDNNRLVVDLIETFLRDLGYDVLRAYDGLEALDAVAVTRPDVIITDLVMPRVDGKKLCRYLRGDPDTRDIPIIVLSGIASEDREGYREVLADAYLAKCAYDRLLPNIKETLREILSARAKPFDGPPQSIVGIEEIYPRELVKEFTIIKKHYDAMLESMAEGVLEIAPEGRIILCNPAAQAILERREEDVIGRRVEGFFEEPARSQVARAVAAFLDGRREHQLLRAEACGKVLAIRLSPIVRASTFDGLFVTMEDVTREAALEAEARDYTRRLEDEVQVRTRELERRNADLEQANRLKDEFLGVLSHELRTPITPIKGYIELMKDNPGEERLAQKALGVLKKQTEHLERLLTDLLDLTALEAGRMELDPREADVVAMMGRVATAMAPQLEERSLTVELDVPAAGLVLDLDVARVEQVVRNLASNAIKFSRDGSQISLGASRRDGKLELRVRDQGIGIAPGDREVIFERFRQLDGSLTRRYPGLGIGLTLAKRIVDLMGGTIEVESEQGSGSTFRVLLPEGQAVAADPRAPVADPRPA